MAENALQPGQGRIGWLYDGQPDTPDLAVMLQDTGDQIVLTVPLKGLGAKDQYTRWFGQGIHYGDDPARTSFSYQPPRELMFLDTDGPVSLVGCRAVGSTSSTLGAGVGRIVPNFAVLGGRNLRYARLNGLRTEIPGLAQWTGVTSIAQTVEVGEDGRSNRLQVTLDSPPSVRLARRMNLTLYPTWRTSALDEHGTLASHDIVQLETTSKRPRSWEEHLGPHIRLRELLLVAAWHSFGFSRLWVHREDDPNTVLSGKAVGDRWSEAVTYRVQRHEPWDRAPRFLFTFTDIGTAGVRRWLELRSVFERAIQPLIAIGDQERGFLEAQVVQSGIAIEALGHQLGVEAGRPPTSWVKYRTALDRVIGELEYNPLGDTDSWKRRSQDCYMGIKHADRNVPDSLILLNTLRENLLVLRLWIAGRLGVKRNTLVSRLALDPHASEYVQLD